MDAEQHACAKCFQKIRAGTVVPDTEKLHIDIPNEELDEVFIEEFVNHLFPELWKEAKHEKDAMTQKEFAQTMFAAGVRMMFYKLQQDASEDESRG
jgi:hypothetical protein